MNITDMILKAVGDALQSERYTTDQSLADLEDKLTKALEEIAQREGPQGPHGEPGASPTVDEIVDHITRQPEFIEALRGKDGKDSSAAEVALHLKADDAFREALKAALKGDPGPEGPAGPEGPQGEPGRDAQPDEVAAAILADEEAAEKLRGPQGEPGAKGDPGEDGADGKDGANGKDGADGKSVTAEEVSEDLLGRPEAVEVLRGLQGEPGAKGDPGRNGKDGRDGKDGVDGKSVTAEEVSKNLLGQPESVKALRGPKGDPGRNGKDGAPGKDGVDGKDADPIEVKDAIKSDPDAVELLRGEPGKDADNDQIADNLKADEDFRAKITGPAGRDGKDGAPGKDADAGAVAKAFTADPKAQAVFKGPKGDPGKNGKDGKDGEPGKPGRDGTDRAEVLVRPIKSGQTIERNEFVTDGNGLYQAVKRANGTPAEDSNAYLQIMAGLARISKGEMGDNHTLDFEMTDGAVHRVPVEWIRVRHAGDGKTDMPGDIVLQPEGLKIVSGNGESVLVKFPQGPRGRKGAKGLDGVGIAHMEYVFGDEAAFLKVLMSDGATYDIDFGTAEIAKDILQQMQEQLDDIHQPITSFRGQWRVDERYSRGEVVKQGSALYLALTNTAQSLSSDDWVTMISMPTGVSDGSGSGGGGTFNGVVVDLTTTPPTSADGTLWWNPAGGGVLMVRVNGAWQPCLPPGPTHHIVSTAPNPGDGNPGDIWFVV